MYILGWFVTSSGHLYNIWKLWQFVLSLDVQSWPSLDVNMVFNIWTLHWVIFLDVMWKSWTTEAIGAAWKSVYNESKFDSEKTSTTVRGGHTDVNMRRSADVEKTTSPAVTKQLLHQNSMSKNALKRRHFALGSVYLENMKKSLFQFKQVTNTSVATVLCNY